MHNGNSSSVGNHRCDWICVCLGGSEDTVECVMEYPVADFEKLLVEGMLAQAWDDEQQRAYEMLLVDYRGALHSMQACLNEMDRRVTVARSTANAA